MIYRVGSLFAGVGGICLGFKNAEYNNSKCELVWANEIDEYAAKTYNNNFDHPLYQGDIEKIVKPEREEDEKLRQHYENIRKEILSEDIDILTGGFPCQAFSIAGERKGFDDHRGNLFLSIIDLVNQMKRKPKVLFLENVKNLMSHDKGNTYKVIKSELINLGYTVKEAILNTKTLTRIPQNRERIIIVCFLDKKVADKFQMFDNIEDYYVTRDEQQRIKDIDNCIDNSLTIDNGRLYYYTPQKYPHYFLTQEQYQQIPEEQRREQRINLAEEITKEYEFYQIRRGMYIRQNMNGVCPTLTANMGTGGHNVPLIKVADGIRKLTPSETFRLQGFPVGNGYNLPNIANGRLYKQAGNAVTVDLITLVANEILKVLEDE